MRVRRDGEADYHFYSSKPPLLPTVVAGLYCVVRECTGWNLRPDTRKVTRAVLLILNFLPMLVALVLLIRMTDRYGKESITRCLIAAVAALGTLLTPFLVTLNNHTVAATAVIFALYSLVAILVEGSTRRRDFALCGFFAAWTACNELPAALFGLAVFSLVYRRNPRLALTAFVPAAAVPLVAWFVTNRMVTDSWMPFYFAYGTDQYKFVVDGVPSYWMEPRGIDRNRDSPFTYLFHCLVGHHGVLSLSPVFVLTLACWCRPGWTRDWPLRTIHRVGMVLSVVVLAFYATRTRNYNYGGVSIALRWMLWLVPFWLLTLMPVIDRCCRSLRFRCALFGLVAVSVFSSAVALPNPWQQPWLFHLMESAGWIDYSDPPEPLTPPMVSWIRGFPENPEAADSELPWVEFVEPSTSGEPIYIRLTAGPQKLINGVRAVRIHLVRSRDDNEMEGESWWVDISRFRESQPLSECLIWPDGLPDAATHNRAQWFFQGLPSSSQQWRPIRTCYVHTPARSDAFRCRHAVAQVTLSDESDSRHRRHRCEVWLLDEVPFGVVRRRSSIRDALTDRLIAFREWTIVGFGPTETGLSEHANP